MNDIKKEIQARKIQLLAGQTTTITEYRTSPNKSWTAVFFSNTQGLNSIRLIQKQLGGGYGTEGEIEYTIGNFPNGDSITGSGSCVILARAEVDCELSYYFVDEVFSQQLPPFCVETEFPVAPTFINFSYPPFGRYFCTIYSTANYDVRLRTSNNQLVLNRSVLGQFFFTNRSYFIHSPNLQLQIRNTVANQIIHVNHHQ